MTPTKEKIATVTVKIMNKPWEALRAYKIHKAVWKALPDKDKKFLVLRDKLFFYRQTKKKNGALFGVYKNGKLKGVVALVKCPDALTAQKKGVLNSPKIPVCSEKPVFVVQALSVLPSECGQKLSGNLLEKAVSYAETKGGAHIFAQMTAANAPSVRQFGKLKFKEAHRWRAPQEKLLLQLNLG